MFICSEVLKDRNMPDPEFYSFLSFLSILVHSSLVCSLIAIYYSSRMELPWFSQCFPLDLHSTNFSQWQTVHWLILWSILLCSHIQDISYNRFPKLGQRIWASCNRKCQSNVHIDFTITLIRYRTPCFAFCGGPVVNNLSANAGHTGLIPGPRRQHTPGSTKPMCHIYWAHPDLESVLQHRRSLSTAIIEYPPLAASTENLHTDNKRWQSQKQTNNFHE